MRDAPTKILCVDDDAYLTDLLRYALTREGYVVSVAHRGADVLPMAKAEAPHLILLDGNLPDADGFELCERVRSSLRIPVIMLTARQADEDVLTGLHNGADDYIGKPFNMQILVYRVRAVLRRTSGSTPAALGVPTTYEVGTGSYDAEHNELVGPRERLTLTRTEGQILRLLLLHEGQVFSAARILERVWGHNTESDVSVIKTHIRHLRIKLGTAVDAAEVVQTVPSVGYTAQRSAVPVAQGLTG